MNRTLLLLLTSLVTLSAYSQNFTEQSTSLGVVHSFGSGLFGGGLSLKDFDGDGDPDISLCTDQGQPMTFYRNDNGTFTAVTFSGVNDSSEAKQVLWCDFDNDHDQDLLITGLASGPALYQNDGAMNFIDITDSSGIAFSSPQSTFGAAFTDYDKDGWLDLYISNRGWDNKMFRNNGDGTFQDVTTSTMTSDTSRLSFCATFFDYDRDGWDDCYIANDKTDRNTLLRNNGDGTFQDISLATQSGIVIDAMCSTIGDVYNDGRFDIYVTNTPTAGRNKILIQNSGGTYEEKSAELGVTFGNTGWGSTFFDFDHDLDQDLYANGAHPVFLYEPNRLYEFEGDSFIVPNLGMQADTIRTYSGVIGDLNGDGFMDIVNNATAPHNSSVWINGHTQGNWLMVDVEGVVSNVDAIGTLIEAYVDTLVITRQLFCGEGYLAQAEEVLHFGLGSYTHIDSLKIYWPSMMEETYYDVCVNRKLHLVEGEASSTGLDIDIAGPTVLCQGMTQTLSIDTSMQNPMWNSGQNTSSIVVNQPGIFWVEAEAANGLCLTSDSLELYFTTPPEFGYVLRSHPTCFGLEDGSIDPAIILGDSNAVYNWSTGSTNAIISGLGAGTYGVTITTNEGCEIRDTFQLTQPDSLHITLSATAETDFDENGTTTVSMAGGTPPYSITWSDSTSSADTSVSGLAAGTYVATVADANGCVIEGTVEVDRIVGIGLPTKDDFTIYPIPFEDELVVTSIIENSEISVVDISGKVLQVSSVRTGDGLVLFTETLDAGIYLVKVKESNGNLFTRLVMKL